MSLDQKKNILAQIAEFLKALQDYPLLESIKGWGGVTFDDSGAIVSASMTSVGAGPWHSLEDSFRGRLEVALTKADASTYLKG
ncbi:phosphotransferase enzyme family protein [Rutstroemia sp. NJR-2017a BBW]|nr:phosphotransferase enzyme family protein [Rutstroemia sp. NJR-2017a BBW]